MLGTNLGITNERGGNVAIIHFTPTFMLVISYSAAEKKKTNHWTISKIPNMFLITLL
jgi:hypothetical protein